MKKFLFFSLVLMASTAFAHNCPNEMKAIDAKLATQPALTASDLSMIQSLRAEGEKFHKEGKHGESMKALGEAKKLLHL